MDDALKIFGSPDRAWPFNDSYAARCSSCGEMFVGPKRAPSCWICAPKSTRVWWKDKHAQSRDKRDA